MESSRSQQKFEDSDSELTDNLDGELCAISQTAVPDPAQTEQRGHRFYRTCLEPSKQATESEAISRCLLDWQVSEEDQAAAECNCEDCSTEHLKEFALDKCPSRFQVAENCNDQVYANDMQQETRTTEECLKPHVKCPFADTGTGCDFQDMQKEMEVHPSEDFPEHLLLTHKELSSIKQDLCSVKQELIEVRDLQENLQQLGKEAKERNETLDILRRKVTEQEDTIERIQSEQSTRMGALEEKVRLLNEADYKGNGIVHGSVAHWNKNTKEDLEMSLLETFQRLDRLERENKELKTTLDVINRGLSTVQKDYRGLTVTMVQHREEIGALDRRTSFLGESKSEPCLALPSGDSGWRRFRRRVMRYFQRSHRSDEGWMNENLQK